MRRASINEGVRYGRAREMDGESGKVGVEIEKGKERERERRR